MLKRLLLAIIALHGFLTHGQCDVAITAVNLETYEVTIEVLNSLGCTANGPGGVNGKVTQLQIGYHLPEPINPDNEVIEDFNETFGLPPCSPNWPGYLGQNPNSNHIGWWYSPSTSVTFQEDIMEDGLVTGDVVNVPLTPPGNYDTYPSPLAECGDDLIDYWLSEDECIEFVVWQLNYGATWYQCNGGWADGTWCPDTYQDMDCDNSWYMCRDENPGAAVASPDFACPPDAPDAVVGNIEFEIGCIGDVPAYQLSYTVFNYGNDTITDYCIEIWNEDYYQCFDGDLFGSYEIPPGEGQLFTTPFFEYYGVGSFFVISVDSVNDEIVTGNNNTVVYYPDELEDLICPEECQPDTIEVVTYILQIDSIFTTLYDTVYDTVYVELPSDTIFETIYELDSIFIELPQDTVFLTEYENIYIYDTTYIEVTDTILVDNYIYEYITDTILVDNYIYETDTLFLTEYVTDTIFITTIDTLIQYEYILINDTVTEYIVQEIYIDCDTGLPCDEGPEFDCPDWTSIYIPNTFTPNNDGINDVWKIMLDLNCWRDLEFQIWNRWGNKIYHGYGDSFDSYPFWDGSIDDGDHYAADGVYTYIVKANKLGSAEVFRKSGHITIFR